MKIFGKLVHVSGNKITLELDDDANIQRIGTLSNGAVPIVEVDVKDARKITSEQRKFIFALCSDCDDWSGYDRGYARQYFRVNLNSITDTIISAYRIAQKRMRLFSLT